MPSLISLCEPTPGPEDQNTITVLESFFLFGPSCGVFFAHATTFMLEIDQGLKEKESSSLHKHLDNCLLQHEKQLEVSGSWARREEVAGGAGQRFVRSVRGERGQDEVRRGGCERR